MIQVEDYYVPEATIRLFSPQWYFQQEHKGRLIMDQFSTKLELAKRLVVSFPYNGSNNLPQIGPTCAFQIGLSFEDACLLGDGHSVRTFMSVANETNQNLTAAQRELLIWHWKLGHANFQWIQALCCQAPERLPTLPTTHVKTSSCCAPKCAACLLAKQNRHGPGNNSATLKPGQDMKLKKNHLRPGDCVLVDQYQTPIPGCLPNTYGKEKKEEQFTGGTICVDHASGYIHHTHQVSLRVGETLKALQYFERFSREHNITIKEFRADNTPFGNSEIVDTLRAHGQRIKFSDV